MIKYLKNSANSFNFNLSATQPVWVNLSNKYNELQYLDNNLTTVNSFFNNIFIKRFKVDPIGAPGLRLNPQHLSRPVLDILLVVKANIVYDFATNSNEDGSNTDYWQYYTIPIYDFETYYDINLLLKSINTKANSNTLYCYKEGYNISIKERHGYNSMQLYYDTLAINPLFIDRACQLDFTFEIEV